MLPSEQGKHSWRRTHMETDAAIAEAEILPTEIEQAGQDAQEPEQGETSEAVETPETEEKKAEESSGEETPEQVAEEKQKKRIW